MFRAATRKGSILVDLSYDKGDERNTKCSVKTSEGRESEDKYVTDQKASGVVPQLISDHPKTNV